MKNLVIQFPEDIDVDKALGCQGLDVSAIIVGDQVAEDVLRMLRRAIHLAPEDAVASIVADAGTIP